MRKRSEAMHGSKAARDVLNRRSGGRLSVLAAVVGLLVLSSSSQAARADPVLESVSPNKGCPGDAITLTGKNFGGGRAIGVSINSPFCNCSHASTKFKDGLVEFVRQKASD